MKSLRLKLNSLWALLFAKEWMIHTIGRKETYSCESMVIATVIDHCASTHNRYVAAVIDNTQADINLEEANKILNG
jgi:hypothetical protein